MESPLTHRAYKNKPFSDMVVDMLNRLEVEYQVESDGVIAGQIRCCIEPLEGLLFLVEGREVVSGYDCE